MSATWSCGMAIGGLGLIGPEESMRAGSGGVNAIVQPREDRVAVAQVGDLPRLHPVLLHRPGQLVEAVQVLAHPLDRVGDGSALGDDERPVARLREQQLARRLVERRLPRAGSCREALDEARHPPLGMVEMAVDGRRGAVEPYLVVALRPPGRGRRLLRLHHWMAV